MKKINFKKVKSVIIKIRDTALLLYPVIKGAIQLWKR